MGRQLRLERLEGGGGPGRVGGRARHRLLDAAQQPAFLVPGAPVGRGGAGDVGGGVVAGAEPGDPAPQAGGLDVVAALLELCGPAARPLAGGRAGLVVGRLGDVEQVELTLGAGHPDLVTGALRRRQGTLEHHPLCHGLAGVLRADPVEERHRRPLLRGRHGQEAVPVAQPGQAALLQLDVEGPQPLPHGLRPLDHAGRRRPGPRPSPGRRRGAGNRVGGSVGSLGTRAGSWAAARVVEVTVEP